MQSDSVTYIHVCAPTHVLTAALERCGSVFQLHPDTASLFRSLETNPGIAIFPGNSTSDMESLREFRQREPEWYQAPVLFSAGPSLQNDQTLGNVTWLDSGASESAIVSALRAALRDRSLQLALRHANEQADERARRSEEEFQQFVYAASHDLKEPLRMISGYLQLLEKRYGQVLEEEAREFIGLAVDGANRMSRLISDLLVFSRVGSRGKPEELVNGNDVLLWLRMNIQKALDEGGVELTSDPLPAVYYDQGEMLQLFELLIGNAMKFGQGRPELRIHIAAEARNSEWVFSVSDNGPGFEPQHAERIFGIFKRLVGRDVPGTGMGLALARRIVEKHGGAIWAKAEPDKGATFYFTVRNAARAASS